MYHQTLYVGALIVSSALGIAVGRWLWSDDATLSTRLFVGVVALHSVVGVLVVAHMLVPDRSTVIALYGVEKAVSAGVMPLWFLFALAYTRRRHTLSRPVVGAVATWYAVLVVLEVTNPLHGLVWSEYEVVGEAIPYLSGTPTPFYSVLTFPFTIFYYAGLGLLGAHALSGPKAARRQSALLFAGYLPPFFIIMAWFYELLPGPLSGALVVGSTWSLAVVGWTVFRHGLFDLVPMARETVFEVLDDPVLVVDEGRRLLDYNDAAAETFPELDGEEGRPLDDTLPALVADSGDGPFASSFTRHADAGPRHYAVTATPLEVGEAVRGYGLVVRDVTESRRHVRDLEQQTEQLKRFASTLSHDIRNPLNVADGRVDLALETGDLDHLEEVSHAHDRIDRIIGDLLTLAREGRRIEEPEQLKVADVLWEAWETTDTDDLTLHVEDDAENMAVYADRSRLQNVFENLLRNSVEHATPDDADAATGVTVTLGRHPDGFYIEDDGDGVPAADRERVFDYEFTTAEEGTGLGLAIVDAIAQAHGWSVEMAEGFQGGTRVVFSGVETTERRERAAGDVAA